MTSEKHKTAKHISENGTLTPQISNQSGYTSNTKPEWANGLRQLYDSVVDEPLPDSFKDLLAQLDDNS